MAESDPAVAGELTGFRASCSPSLRRSSALLLSKESQTVPDWMAEIGVSSWFTLPLHRVARRSSTAELPHLRQQCGNGLSLKSSPPRLSLWLKQSMLG